MSRDMTAWLVVLVGSNILTAFAVHTWMAS